MFKKIICFILLVSLMLCVGCAKTEKDEAQDVGDALKVVADRFVTYVGDRHKITEACKNGEITWDEWVEKAGKTAKEAYDDVEKKTTKLEKIEVREKVRPLKAKAIRITDTIKKYIELQSRAYDTSPQMAYQMDEVMREFDRNLDDFKYDYYFMAKEHWYKE